MNTINWLLALGLAAWTAFWMWVAFTFGRIWERNSRP